jgi:hypothetical protein
VLKHLQWDCVARANSLQVDTHYWGNFTVDHFRRALHAMDNSTLIALNFDRRGVSAVSLMYCLWAEIAACHDAPFTFVFVKQQAVLY